MLQRVLVAISVGAALSVLVILIIRTQDEPHMLQGHLSRITALSQLRLADAEVDVQITRARLTLSADADGLLHAAERLNEAQTAVAAQRVDLQAMAPELSHLSGGLLQQIDEKTALLTAYRSQLGRFATAYAQLLQQSEAVLADTAAPASAALRGLLRQLVEDVTTYSLQSSPTNRTEIERLLTALALDPGSSATSRSRLAGIGRSATTVLREKDETMDIAGKLAAIPVADTLDRLQQRYVAYHVHAEDSRGRYRLVLAIYAAALLVVFGLLGWRLRRSYGELDRSYAQLQDLNSHLEETVESRTAELRTALDDLRQQQVQLIQSEKMAALGQMVAGVAHEINTPLGYARGNVETVRDSLPLIREVIASAHSDDVGRREEALRRWPPEDGFAEIEMLLGDANYGLDQIGDLVLGLKDFSRVDRSLTESFNLNEGLETALKICQSQLKNRVEIRREYGDLPLVPCAPSQINQVFLNLLTNAAQAIEGEGIVTLRTRVDADQAVIEIADSGCGMDPETLAHIFEPFFTTKPVGQGTGLGLSIVFRIIEDHRGRIEAESTPGVGTTFRIRLPLRSSAEAMLAAASEEALA